MCYENHFRQLSGGRFYPLSSPEEWDHLRSRLSPQELSELDNLNRLVHQANILLHHLNPGDFELGLYMFFCGGLSPCVRVRTLDAEAVAREALETASVSHVDILLELP